MNVYRDVTFVKNTPTGDDDNGHGSHVAGTVAAKDNLFGIIGVAPGARLWAIKVCGEQLMLNGLPGSPVSNQIKGLDFVIQHADELDVANISIDNTLNPLLNKAASKAVAAGVTVVASGRNHHKDVRFTSPAHNPDVISISAIADSDGKCGGLSRSTKAGPDDTLANFSNFGRSVTIAGSRCRHSVYI
jgi:subtilisin family serine protease